MRKQAIFNFVKANLPESFQGKIYWSGERKDEPKKPFCLLSAIIPEQTDSRTTERELAGNIQEVTMYKNMVVTFAVYVNGVNSGADFDVQNEKAENTARNLKNIFDTLDATYEFYEAGMSIDEISALRNLTETTSGGYTYRYEFDVTFGFDDVVKIQKQVGNDVKLNIEREIKND